MDLRDLLLRPDSELTEDELVYKMNNLKKARTKEIDGELVVVPRKKSSKSNASRRKDDLVKGVKAMSPEDILAALNTPVPSKDEILAALGGSNAQTP